MAEDEAEPGAAHVRRQREEWEWRVAAGMAVDMSRFDRRITGA